MKVNRRSKALVFCSMAFSVIVLASSFTGSTTQAVSDSEAGGPFSAEHDVTVQCASTQWSTTTFYNSSGQIVGQTIIEGGILKASYSGSYSSSTTASGGVAAHSAVMIQCYGSSWWPCFAKSAVEACQ